MKYLTYKGSIELDLEKILLQILIESGRAGASAESLSSAINARYGTLGCGADHIDKVLANLGKLVSFANGKWHAHRNSAARLDKLRHSQTKPSKRYKAQVRYTKQGWGRIIVPQAIIEKLGKPASLYVTLVGDTLTLSP
jgi:hypothetical protein